VLCITVSWLRLRCNGASPGTRLELAMSTSEKTTSEGYWVGAVASCLMLQFSLIGLGLFVDRWFNPKAPCCIQHQVL
jgi:hypothetical protein